VNPFHGNYTNHIIQAIKEYGLNVTGLILVTNEFMIANASYAEPQLISRATVTAGEILAKYSF
jgi:hypothetical protein